MSFEINDMKLFATWTHKGMLDIDCTICRQLLNNPSIYNKEKGILKSSILKSPTCNHAFHTECIEPWIQTNNRCPNCSQKWQYS